MGKRKSVSIAFTGAATAAFGTGLAIAPVHAVFAGATAAVFGTGPAVVPTATQTASGGTFNIRQNGGLYKGIFTGKNVSGVKAFITDSTHLDTETCAAATNSGSFPASSVKQAMEGIGQKIGAMSHAKFSQCSLLGIPVKITLNRAANLSASFYSSGVTRGRLKSFSATLSGPVGQKATCTVKIKAKFSVPLSYKNHSHRLYLDPKATPAISFISPTSGCPIIQNGDKGYVQGTYSITTPNALTISQK
jgi:hypothetical protein